MADRVIRVQSLSGARVAELCGEQMPETIGLLKDELCAKGGVQKALVRLVHGDRIFGDNDRLDEAFGDSASLDLTLVVDESPLFTWNCDGNPRKELLAVEAMREGSTVTFLDERCDYVNVLTAQPVMRGVHYFEFIMHVLGDEQWCGVTACPDRAGYHGSSFSPESKSGWFYYSGRRYAGSAGALHAPQEYKTLLKFGHVQSGDIIGLVVDLRRGALVFLLNGEIQGACSVGTDQPLYVCTSLDRREDKVELRKPPLADAPAAALEVAASGELTPTPAPPGDGQSAPSLPDVDFSDSDCDT